MRSTGSSDLDSDRRRGVSRADGGLPVPAQPALPPFHGESRKPTSASPQLFGLTSAQRRLIRIGVFGGMGLLMLAGVGIGFVPYYTASRDMQRFCAALAVDTPAAEAQARAALQGYDVVSAGEGRVLLMVPSLAPQVPSKRGCDLRVGPAGLLVSATYRDSL